MAAFPGAGGRGLLIGGAVRSLLWSGGALVIGLDLDGFMSSAGSFWLDAGVSSLLSMMVFLSLQVTDFVVSEGVVVSSFSTVYRS